MNTRVGSGEMAMNKTLLQGYAFKCLGFHYSRLGEIERSNVDEDSQLVMVPNNDSNNG